MGSTAGDGPKQAMADVAGAVAATADDERIVCWFAETGRNGLICDHGVVAMASVKTGGTGGGVRGACDGDAAGKPGRWHG